MTHILRHKSWHVFNKKNIEKVRKDEAKQKEGEEKERQRQIRIVRTVFCCYEVFLLFFCSIVLLQEQERRYNQLRAQAREQRGEQPERDGWMTKKRERLAKRALIHTRSNFNGREQDEEEVDEENEAKKARPTDFGLNVLEHLERESVCKDFLD